MKNVGFRFLDISEEDAAAEKEREEVLFNKLFNASVEWPGSYSECYFVSNTLISYVVR